ncbi:hypothetical protein TUM18999_27530 [Pseudomonas tohonis]|uniref:Uncharacterized protein n=1 Tax=Pseudomonas tohonis TaxID=2725477 RepID=A0A6J4E472_9PSED|nr:hypothetical protein [Pseudomonas tohonis]BCG24562.1 hypothetical protein TUM18999_27530 [Pseudomonas tohonis]GJN52079.1 hypothetical protein TUM20286_18310 [Pseudomonas tohonis]
MQTTEQARANLETARALLGRSLAGVRNARYLFNGTPNAEAVGEIEFACEDGVRVTFSLASDGESVLATARALKVIEGFEISDNDRCDWRAEDLLVTLDAGHLVGLKVVEVEGLQVTYSNQDALFLAGFRVTLEEGDYLVFFNCGDEEAVCLNQLPPPLSGVDERWIKEI